MKILRFVVVAALALLAVPAFAQWQTPNHSVPIGRGGGVTGFGSAAPGTTNLPFLSNGASSDPSFRILPNAGMTPGAADTYKGSLNGTTVTDVAMPNCTSTGSALRYAAGVGPNCGAVVALTGFDMPINLGLSVSAASSALTFTVTQAGGSAPTAQNPVTVPFRSTTAATGTVALGTITSSITLTIPSGATLGTSNLVPFRIWIFLNYNGGTPALGVATCSTTTTITIYPCVAWESTLKTSTTISAGATAAGQLYATTGVGNDAVRIVGYCDFASGLVTAGAWASTCTTLQVVGPGTKKPGDVVQTIYASSTASTTSSGSTPTATSLTGSVSPSTSMNLIRATANGTFINGSGGVGATANAQIRRGTSTGVGSVAQLSTASSINAITAQVTLDAFDLPATTSATSYTVYVWETNAGGNAVWNGSTLTTTLVINEIMGFDVREPANDNLNPGVFSQAG